MEYGLIGGRLGHSFSKDIHEKMSGISYNLVELAPDEVEAFLQRREFKGINVTIPYKQTVIPYLDELDESARLAGAVNTIVNRDGRLIGYNTDVDGVEAMAAHACISFEGRRVTILGTGGASKAVAAAARRSGAASVKFASRHPEGEDQVPIDDVTQWMDTDILVNATPTGMSPDTEGIVQDTDLLPFMNGVLDCVYNPLRTNLVIESQWRGIPSEGGLMMLTAQAVKAREHFLGIPYDRALAESIYNEQIRSRRNIVLIGMPSSGKSTVGAMIAARLGREFIDTDDLIIRKAGMSIPEIFAKHGEGAFRSLESDIIAGLAQFQGKVIATGGGAVLNWDNVRRLSQNGRIYLVLRDPEKLTATADRPLSRDKASLQQLLQEREPVYRSVAEGYIDNNTTPEEAVDSFLREFYGEDAGESAETAARKPEQAKGEILHMQAGDAAYDIVIGRGALDDSASYPDLGRKVLVVTDDLVPAQYADRVLKHCPEAWKLTLQHGEEHKNTAALEAIWSELRDHAFSRRDLIIAVGGGVVGDICGFAAASYMRGIDFCNIPTTLLSQLDSSIGGKTAVNFGGVKNLIGAFHHPCRVIIDPDTLGTLSERLYAEGLAEAVKMAATSDAALFTLMENSKDIRADIDRIIPAALRIKKDVVEQDPEEKGLRRVLNFGHTVGHAIEAVSGQFYHGESVAIGMMYMSEEPARSRIKALLERLGLPTRDDCPVEELMEVLSRDKKKTSGGIATVWVSEIGSFEFRTMAEKDIELLIKNHRQQ